MYSSIALIAILSSAASTTLAVPVGTGFKNPSGAFQASRSHTVLRELARGGALGRFGGIHAIARDGSPSSSTDESGAIKTGLIKDGIDIANGIVNGISGIKDIFSREELEILARQAAQPAATTTAASSLPTDASGAIDVKKILSTVGSVASVVLPFLKREDLELLARDAAATDASGAINFGKILSTAASVIGSILKREELEELLARDVNPATLPTDQSGAINFGKILSTAASVIGSILKREELEELLARDGNTANLPTDESGAINFGKILSTAASVIGSILKREELEALLARDVNPATIPTDQSGAINFGKILSTAASVIGSILKREEEMVARSLNELD